MLTTKVPLSALVTRKTKISQTNEKRFGTDGKDETMVT